MMPRRSALYGVLQSRLACLTTCCCLLILTGTADAQFPADADYPGLSKLQTVAEASDYQATSHHAQVVALMERLADESEQASLLSMGMTNEGRDIPVLVFADTVVDSAQAAQLLADSEGKLIVLVFGNIHAGEVAGKEALLKVARELATDDHHPLLNDLIIAIAPIYNADGNERFDKNNRPGQKGPAQGMGQRANAQGLDLNRDFIKMEAPETRALIGFMRQWDPAIVIDTHTTNGSFHRYVVTYAGPKVPAGDTELIKYVRDTMLPAVSTELEDRTGILTFPYGDFNRDHTTWNTFPAHARYSTSYVGMRNRIGILSEAYSYASYQDRITGSLEFVRSCLTYAADHTEDISNLLKRADERGKAATWPDGIAMRTTDRAAQEKVTVKGYVEETAQGARRPRPLLDQPRDYEDVELWDRFDATHSVTPPWAYLIPASFEAEIEKLKRHGLEIEILREDIVLETEVYRITNAQRPDRAFQGHRLTTLEVEMRDEARMIPAGTRIVKTAQALGNLAAYLLEPSCEDGLAAWGGFGAEQLKAGDPFPVQRLVTKEPPALLTASEGPLPEDVEPGGRITFDRWWVQRDIPRFNENATRVGRWLDDERYVHSKGGGTWSVDARTGQMEAYQQPEQDTSSQDDMVEALLAVEDIPADRRQLANSVRRSRTRSADGSAAMINLSNDLYWVATDGSSAVRLTDSPNRNEEMAELADDGSGTAFVYGNDLYAVDVETQTLHRLTNDGTDVIRNGRAAWVYFEEVFGRSWKTFWTSPNGDYVGFLRLDSTDVPVYTIVDNRQVKQRIEHDTYPKVGEPNPTVRLGVGNINDGSTAWVDLPDRYDGQEILITRVFWYPDSSRMIFYVQDRVQSWLDFCTANPDGTDVKVLFRDENEGWIEPNRTPTFLADGSFLFYSNRTGYDHVYHYAADGRLISRVTQGDGDVRSMVRIDEANQVLYFMSELDSPTGSDFYRVNFDGSNQVRLTADQGTHQVTLSPGNVLFIDSWSNWHTPNQVAVRSALDGSLVRTLDINPVFERDRYDLGEFSQFQIMTDDGFALEASMLLPPGFDPAKKYPVWYTTYGGPSAPTISDSWHGLSVWDECLASEGFILFHADPRSASGKGAVSAWTAYKQLGVQEAIDITTAINWLKSHPWVDGDRIGMSGHSYGGYITAYAMTHTDLFAAGIAGAPVTDWREYDTIYTERYMLTPDQNPEGYSASSVIEAASRLHGRLLLVHGALDDNVHSQNTLRLAKAFQDANKTFEMMIYPDSRHGIWGSHYRQLQIEFIRKTLGSPEPDN
ncbi:MAG: prolyl oligopeptidase family serine peptidase [Planctomycetes bacterium]|nr:prolyl oligopeptidase family serine peptidase [Planctomycetota bacterium]